MNKRKLIYKILQELSRDMEYEVPCRDCISPEHLGISRCLRDRLLVLMSEAGYIEGILLPYDSSDGASAWPSVYEHPLLRITMAWIEYLDENRFEFREASGRE